MKHQLTISGMSCHHCVAAVTEALKQVSDVQVEQVGMGMATIATSSPAALEAARKAILEEGYEVTDAVEA